MKHEYILHLFRQLKNGNISSEELDALKAWTASHPDEVSKYEERVEESWEQFRKRIHIEKSDTIKPLNPFKKWIRVAASIAVLICACVGFSHYYFNQSIEEYAEQGVKEVELYDGSIITLDEGASIHYARNFGKRNRAIQLTGTAYFDVAKNPDLPFVIKTKSSTTQVLGTQFYLGEQDGNVSLDVVEGRVKFSVDTISRIKTIGQSIVVNTTNNTVTTEAIDPNTRYWKSNELIFENTPLTEVIHTLESVYDQPIQLDSDITACKLTSSFSKSSLSDILDVLAITYQGEWTKKDGVFHVKNINCN